MSNTFILFSSSPNNICEKYYLSPYDHGEKPRFRGGKELIQCHSWSNVTYWVQCEPYHLIMNLLFSLTIDATHICNTFRVEAHLSSTLLGTEAQTDMVHAPEA